MDERRVAKVVQTIAVENLSTSLEPDGLLDWDTCRTQTVRSEQQTTGLTKI